MASNDPSDDDRDAPSAGRARAPKVFCSYGSLDRKIVTEFAVWLRSKGVDAWLDTWEVAAGQSFVAKIAEGLAEAEHVLVFLSKTTHERFWAGLEMETAVVRMVEERIPVVPVVIDDDAQIPLLLRTRSRRGIEERDSILDAIQGRSDKPLLGPVPEVPRACSLVVSLREGAGEAIDITLREDDEILAQEPSVRLPERLRGSYGDFLQRATTKPLLRSPADGARAGLAQALAERGEQLDAVVLHGAVGEAMRERLAGVAIDTPVELGFESDTPALLSLPFEALRHGATAALALRPGATIVRRWAEGSARHEPRPPQPGPFKILVAVGAPDEDKTAAEVLDLERELELIFEALEVARRHENAQIEILEVGGLEQIRHALSRDAFHVLHLSGHGGAGVILLENEDGGEERVTTEALAAILRDAAHPPPLLFLSCCHGATASEDAVGLAQGLTRLGVPLVVAMQAQVSDRYASDLAGAFYAELLGNARPRVSLALAAARRKIERERQRQGAARSPEWATPALYCAGLEPELLNLRTDKQPLMRKPVHHVEGTVPMFRLGELVGRRAEQRKVRRVLLEHARSIDLYGRMPGVAISGIGGVGKSALAGRVMTRCKEDGWVIATLTSTIDRRSLAKAVGKAVVGDLAKDTEFHRVAVMAKNGTLDDEAALAFVDHALRAVKVLLVLDNFEDNLSVGGDAFLVEESESLLRQVITSAESGGAKSKLLLTCRYSVPGECGHFLARIPLGPLSHAQLLKFRMRLPALRDLASEQLWDVVRLIGGHPRMLEYLDGLMRGGQARLPEVAKRLRAALEAANKSSRRKRKLEQALDETALLGAQSIVLDELLALLDEGQREILLQIAVSGLPIAVSEIGRALHGRPTTTAEQDSIELAVERLQDLSLLTELDDENVWVHRWTAEALAREESTSKHQDRCRKAAAHRVWRMQEVSPALEDLQEATRNHLDGEAFDEAAALASTVGKVLQGRQQLSTMLIFVDEVLRRMPDQGVKHADLIRRAGRAQFALGHTKEALQRYEDLIAQQLTRHEPNPEYQRDLSVSYNKLGDLHRALGQGERARHFYEQSLALREGLAKAEPDRADYQYDLSLSYERLAAVALDAGEGDHALEIYGQAVAIKERLVAAEPDRVDLINALATDHLNIGRFATQLDREELAIQHLAKAYSIWSELHATDRLPHDRRELFDQLASMFKPKAE